MTITRRGALTGITMRGTPGTRVRFVVDWVRIETVIAPGDTEEQTIDDAVFEVTTSATVDYEAQAIIRPTHPDADVSQITWSTSDESIATIDASGKVTRVSDGYIRIIATDQHGAVAKSGLVHIYREAGVESKTWLAWVEGSAAKAISDAIDGAIADGDVADIKPMYTSGNTRNPNCWAAELADLSCIDRNKPNATYIGTSGGYSYAIQAGHYPDGTDTFVAMDGTVQSVTVADSRRVGPTVPGYGPEIKIVRYSTALDAKFVPALLPPANLNDYFRHLSIGVPLICTDQEKKALVADLYSLGTWATAKVPTDTRRLAFYESAIVGDSGSPRFVPVDGRLMLITALTYGGAGSGPNYSQYLSEILDAIDDMGGDVEDFEIADLSGWTNYAMTPSEAFIALMKSYDWNGYWPLNETSGTIAFDHSGNGRHGTILANVGVADIDSVFADGSKAMRFTHMQDNCHVALPDVPEINALTQLTVMALARANSFHNTNAIISNARDCCGEYNGWDLWLNRYAPTQPRPALTQWNNGTLNVNHLTTDYTLEANRWYHIAATYDGSITKVYLDGVLALTSPISANRIGAPATYPTKIGKMGQSTTNGLDGWASHVAVKGEALSDADIATIAAAALAEVNT